jgi:hypothetical protein
MRNAFFLYLLVIQVILTVIACAESSDQNNLGAVVDVELSSIRDDLALYRSLDTEEDGDGKFRVKIAQSILRHVMIVRAANPKIRSLRGEPLETICLLTESDTRKILNEAGDPQLAGLAYEYLLGIEAEVRNKIEGYQKTMKGSGCSITPIPE